MKPEIVIEKNAARLSSLGRRTFDQAFRELNNPDDFDAYLARFNRNQRRNIRRERSYMDKMDLEIRTLTGDQISEDMAAVMYAYYQKTNEQFGPWGCKYLTADFFERVFRQCRHRLLLMAAYDRTPDKVPLALSMLLTKNRHLIGRYWGCEQEFDCLHFEACYYQAIDFAIARGLKKVEAGAQGGHKVARGYLPEATYSAHWISDQGFRDAVQRFLEDERRYVAEDIDYTEQRSPFKSTIDLGIIRGS